MVDCREETQVGRVVARNALGVADIQKIMASQVRGRICLAAADWVLFNDGISGPVGAQHTRNWPPVQADAASGKISVILYEYPFQRANSHLYVWNICSCVCRPWCLAKILWITTLP